MMAIMVLPSISVRADNNSQSGKVQFNTSRYAQLSVTGGNMDCDFGTVNPLATPNPTCRPTGSLLVSANSTWTLTTVKSQATPVNIANELINVLRVENQTTDAVLVDFGTSSGATAGSGNVTIPIQYELRAGSGPAGGGYLANLPPRSGNDEYSVTVTYTLSTP